MGSLLKSLGLVEPKHWQAPAKGGARQFFENPQPSVASVEAAGEAATAAAAAAAAKKDPQVQWPGPITVNAAKIDSIEALIAAQIKREGGGAIDFMVSPASIKAAGTHTVHARVAESATHREAPWRKLTVQIEALDPQLTLSDLKPIPIGTPGADVESAVNAAVKRKGEGRIVIVPAPATVTTLGTHTLQVSVEAQGLYGSAKPAPLKMTVVRADPMLELPASITLKVGESVEAAVRAGIKRLSKGDLKFSRSWDEISGAGKHELFVEGGEDATHAASPPKKMDVIVERLASTPKLKKAEIDEPYDAANAKKAGYLRDAITKLIDRQGADGLVILDPANPAYAAGVSAVKVWLGETARYAKSTAPLSVDVRLRPGADEIVSAADAWFKDKSGKLSVEQKKKLVARSAQSAYDVRMNHLKTFATVDAVATFLDGIVGAMATPTLTRVALWKLLGVTLANASDWDMSRKAEVPVKDPPPNAKARTVHLSISGDSIKVPTKIAGKSANELYKECLIDGVKAMLRVHASLEVGEPKPHMYLGGFFDNPAGKANKDDQVVMKKLISDFETQVKAAFGKIDWSTLKLPGS